MQRDMFATSRTDPNVVFENLEWTRVKVELEDHDRKTAVSAIQDVIENIQDKDDKSHVLFLIAYAIRQQLFKSKEIAVETIKKLAAWHPRCVEIDDDHNDFEWAMRYEDVKLFSDAEEEEEEEDDDGFEEYYEEEDAGEEEVADGNHCDLKEREAAMKEFEEAGMNELKRESDFMGCSLKQGQEQEILSQIISYFCQQNYKIVNSYTMRLRVERFMSRVKGYISSTCTLKDLDTVNEALRIVKEEIEADGVGPVHEQKLDNNTVPTNEEGSECEILTPFNLPEQEEICLTPPDCENTKTEDCWFATAMNQPEEEEKIMVDVNFYLARLGEDMKTGECAARARSKRKLAQL